MITNHANKRIRQRIAKTDSTKLFAKALKHGYPPSSYTGSFRRYLDKECADYNSHAVVYKNNIFFYKPQVMVVTTVYQVPTKYRKYKAYEEKTPSLMAEGTQ